jgi:PASTA domain-containing protein
MPQRARNFVRAEIEGTLAGMKLESIVACLLAALVAAGIAASTAAAGSTPQTIVVQVPAPATATYNTAFTVNAQATSGLAVAFSASGACTNTGTGSTNRFQMTSGTGTCTVMFNQAGDATYAAAPQVTETVTATKADQTIQQFDQPADKTWGDPDFDLGAFTSSGLDPTFSASGNCTVTGMSLHITGAGSCTVTAAQPGDANFNPAPPLSRTFPIAKEDQTITFLALADRALGDPDFTVKATSDSKLPVSFSAKGACTVTGRRVHLRTSGDCTIVASQSGNANFKAAKSVPQKFHVAKPRCAVPRLVGKTVGAAKRALRANRCGAGKITYVHTVAGKRGRVVKQGHHPGVVLPVGTKITLVVGRR